MEGRFLRVKQLDQTTDDRSGASPTFHESFAERSFYLVYTNIEMGD
jgi:hypothetical protein